MDTLRLFVDTILLRPYVFFFLAISLYAAHRLLGWQRTRWLFGITWLVAFVSEFASTRIGVPFGDYYYNGSTGGQELYVFDIPFMDSLSFTFLLYASYCMALVCTLARDESEGARHWICDRRDRTSWPTVALTTVFFTFIDIVIDPVALRGDRWFLGLIYGYPHEGIYFGVPLANFAGWAVVGATSISLYRIVDRHPRTRAPFPQGKTRQSLLIGVGLYYLVLCFNIVMTFWIGEHLIGLAGCFIYAPLSAVLLHRIFGPLPHARQPTP